LQGDDEGIQADVERILGLVEHRDIGNLTLVKRRNVSTLLIAAGSLVREVKMCPAKAYVRP
jgi:hypothetical protein